MDSANEFIEKNYMHKPDATERIALQAKGRAAATFNRIRIVLLAFNVAAALALIAFAIITIV